jgi:hypothetical protein
MRPYLSRAGICDPDDGSARVRHPVQSLFPWSVSKQP